MSRPVSRADRDLADRLHSAAIHLLRSVRRTDPLTGVSAAQLSALSVLMGGRRTLGELAAAEQVRAPTMSRLVAEMEGAGLVARTADAADARVVRVSSTAKGKRVLAKGRQLRIAALAARFAALDGHDRAAIADAIRAIERVVR